MPWSTSRDSRPRRLPSNALPPRARWRRSVPGADLEIEFRSGARTRCVFATGGLRRLDELSAQVGLTGTAGLLCDARLLSTSHRDALLAYGATRLGAPLARPVDEARKTLEEVEEMCDALAARGVQRDGFVVAVGGGVFTDLGGLAAALYLRGVPWVSAPTTLLAQVDAGLGGKTGANLRAGKNLVGAFHQPRLVVCDAEVLGTLPVRERWSGLAEVVKCALLSPAQDASGMPLLERCERDLERAAEGKVEARARSSTWVIRSATRWRRPRRTAGSRTARPWRSVCAGRSGCPGRAGCSTTPGCNERGA